MTDYTRILDILIDTLAFRIQKIQLTTVFSYILGLKKYEVYYDKINENITFHTNENILPIIK